MLHFIQLKQKQTTEAEQLILLALSFYWLSLLQLMFLFSHMTELGLLHWPYWPIRIYLIILIFFCGGGGQGKWGTKMGLKRCKFDLDILQLKRNSSMKSPTTDMSHCNLLTDLEEWLTFLWASCFSLLSWEFKNKNQRKGIDFKHYRRI